MLKGKSYFWLEYQRKQMINLKLRNMKKIRSKTKIKKLEQELDRLYNKLQDMIEISDVYSRNADKLGNKYIMRRIDS